MKFSKRVNYNFDIERYKKESAREFITQFLDESHVDIVMKMAYENNMSVEHSTAYALAMFNALQDLFYFHYDLVLGEIKVEVVRTLNGETTNVKDRDLIFSFREALQEPYFTNRNKSYIRVKSSLTAACRNKDRFVEGIKNKNPKSWAKKEKKRKEKLSEASKRRYIEKRRRIQKKRKRDWGY